MKKFCEALQAQQGTEHAYDMVLIQELWMLKDQNYLKDCGFPYSVSLDRRYLDSGLMILSRYPILNSFRLAFEHRYDPHVFDAERFVHKSALFALIEHPLFGEMWVINTHLSAPNKRYSNESLRVLQLKEIRDKIDFLNSEIPIILGGDFNAGEGQPDLSWIAFKELFPEFREAQTKCEDSNPEARFSVDRVDHLFTTAKLSAQCGAVAMDQKFRNRQRKSIHFSDHAGMETLFRLTSDLN